MRILLVNTYYYPNMIGGTEHSVKLLAEGLIKRGHEVYVLTCDKKKDGKDQEVINGVHVIRIYLAFENQNVYMKLLRKINFLRNFYILNRLNKILDEVKPDVIHTNNLFYFSTVIWKCAAEKNIKVVHTLRDYWGLCRRITLLNKKGDICHKPELLCKMHRTSYKTFTKYVDTVTAASKFTLDLYTNKNNMFEKSRKQVVYNAIDFNYEEHLDLLNHKLKNQGKTVKFLFIGSLDVHKGIKFAIEAFMNIDNPNIRLTICGDGELKEYVRKSQSKDSRITYLGKVFAEEKEKVLIDSDVMLVPSIWYEPFGRVVIEAYKYAMPVIGTDIGGIPELLTENTSIKIKINSHKQLIGALEKFSSRKNIKKAIKNVSSDLSRYNLENQLNEFEKLYLATTK